MGWKIKDLADHLGRVTDWGTYGMTVKERKKGSLVVELATELNVYTVVGQEAKKGKPSQLSCAAVDKASGRGNDLARGPLELTTWYHICQDILWFELATATLKERGGPVEVDDTVWDELLVDEG
jgi:hypothetical protein